MDEYKRLKRIWYGMKHRCHGKNITCDAAFYYKDKGISVCPEWRDSFESFKQWAINNGYSDELTIDRIDSERDYEPENCQWITRAENSRKAVLERGKSKRKRPGKYAVRYELKGCDPFFYRYADIVKTGLHYTEAAQLCRELNAKEPPFSKHEYRTVPRRKLKGAPRDTEYIKALN